MSRFPFRAGARGFTLLELLVVMSLLSLVMLGLGSGMQTMVKAESGMGDRLAFLDEARVARRFIVQVVSQVSARTQQQADGKTSLLFEALPERLTWIGVMPVRPGVGGLHQFQLLAEPGENGRSALVLSYRPWTGQDVGADWSDAQRRVLLWEVEEFRIEAQGLPPKGRQHPVAWPEGWQAGWPVPDRLPEQIRITFTDAPGKLQPLVINLHATVQSDDIFTTVTVGAGARR